MRAPANQRFLTLALLAVVIAVLPFVFPSSYYFRVASLVWVSALAAVGLNILMGQAGQVSLGHAAFFGIGAYAVAIGPTHLGIPSWAALLIGAVLSAALAYLVGRPILRLKGHYLAIATLGLGVLVALVITTESRWTGGPDGMPVERLTLFGWRVSGSYTWYWVTGGLLLVGTWIALNLDETPTGRAFRALMGRPKLLLLDEPSLGLSPLLVDQILDAIVSLKKDGITVLLVEQNASAALAIADRGYVLETGKVAYSGAGSMLLADPQVKAAYLGID